MIILSIAIIKDNVPFITTGKMYPQTGEKNDDNELEAYVSNYIKYIHKDEKNIV